MEPNCHIPTSANNCKFIPPLKRILSEVAHRNNISIEEIRSRRIYGYILAARFEFFYRAVTETSKSCVAIGKFLGFHHTTVLSGINRHCQLHGLERPQRLRNNIFRGKRPLSTERWLRRRAEVEILGRVP